MFGQIYVQNALLSLNLQKHTKQTNIIYRPTNTIICLANNSNVLLDRTAQYYFNKIHVHYNILYTMLFKTSTSLATECSVSGMFIFHTLLPGRTCNMPFDRCHTDGQKPPSQQAHGIFDGSGTDGKIETSMCEN